MKLKYYLRGLGIGVAMMAILMLITGATKKSTLSDEEIKQKAEELGMIESSVLADFNSKAQESDSVSESAEETIYEKEPELKSEPVSEKDSESKSEPVAEKEPESKSESVVEKEPESKSESVSEKESESKSESQNEMILITVHSGDGSDTVSRYVFQAGLVEDAAEFDRYLCSNEYDKKLRVGEHSIKGGATWEEIAKSLTQ